MAGQFIPKPRDKNLLDSKRIVLSTPCPVKDVKGQCELHYYANNDNPGITVYTRDPNDKDNNFGRIQAKFGILDMQIHLEQLDTVLRSKEPIKLDVTCRSVRGKDSKQVIDAARVEVGKRPDGVVYIHVEDLERQGRPMIYFPFAPTYWHRLGKNGQPCTEAEVSVMVARGIYNLVGRAMTMVSVNTYKHPEPKDNNGGGFNRGGNRGGNNYNNQQRGNSQPSTPAYQSNEPATGGFAGMEDGSFDDDVTF